MSLTRRLPLRDTTDADEEYDVEFSRNADAVDCRGVAIQDDSSNDSSTIISRTGNDMTFKDGNNPSGTTLSAMLAGGGITALQHETLLQLIHLADGVGGPMEGFASGAYRETLPAADPFPTQITWYTDNTKAKKIIVKSITYNTNKTPSVISYTVYLSDGVTAGATVSDSISYSSVFEINRTRTVT